MSDPAPCPPHRWLIVERRGQQQWTCQGCGAVEEHSLRKAQHAARETQQKARKSIGSRAPAAQQPAPDVQERSGGELE